MGEFPRVLFFLGASRSRRGRSIGRGINVTGESSDEVFMDLPDEKPSGLAQPAKVLLIEDDLLTSNIYRNYLVVEGYSVEVAVDGPSALKLLEEFSPDLAIVDLMLPGP